MIDTGKAASIISTNDVITVAIIGGITLLQIVARPIVAEGISIRSIIDGMKADIMVGIEMMMNAITITKIGVRMIKDIDVGDHRLAIPILYLITLYSHQPDIGPATNTAMVACRTEKAPLTTNIDKTGHTTRQR